MTGITFAWYSSNTTVASVTAINSEGETDGIATGLAAGSTQIKACANGVSAINPHRDRSAAATAAADGDHHQRRLREASISVGGTLNSAPWLRIRTDWR